MIESIVTIGAENFLPGQYYSRRVLATYLRMQPEALAD
jgi:hypothetical protein